MVTDMEGCPCKLRDYAMVDWRQGCHFLSLLMPGTYHGQGKVLLLLSILAHAKGLKLAIQACWGVLVHGSIRFMR
jgi:hypothetical protein